MVPDTKENWLLGHRQDRPWVVSLDVREERWRWGHVLITCKVPGTSPKLNHLSNPAGLMAMSLHPPPVIEEVTKALEAT